MEKERFFFILGVMNSMTNPTNITRSKSNSRSYPWCQKSLNFYNPFPRYDFSVSDHVINDELLIFGGLVQEKATNDLYSIDISKFLSHTHTFSFFPLSTLFSQRIKKKKKVSLKLFNDNWQLR